MDSKVQLLIEAQEAIELAIENIKSAVRGTSEQGRAEAYILPHLQSWIDGSEVITIEKLIEKFGEEEEGLWSQEDMDDLEAAILEYYGNIGNRKLDMIMEDLARDKDGLLSQYQPGDEKLLIRLGSMYDL